MKNSDLSWSVPVMRIGFTGKGLVYIIVAGFSLYAIWHGGRAQTTASVLSQLETTTWGKGTLFLIFLGMIGLPSGVWSTPSMIFDDRGADAKGIAARSGMIGAALIHLAITDLAFSLLFTGSNQGGDSSIAQGVLERMGLKGDKAAEMSVSNALTALAKSNQVSRREGKYVVS